MTELTDHEILIQVRIDQARSDVKVSALMWLEAAQIMGLITLIVGLGVHWL